MAKTKVTGGYIADSAITPDHLHTSLDISSKTLTIGATTVSGHLIPSANITYDLGSSTNRFRDIYLDGTTINLGGTELKKNSDGDIEFKSGSNFKRLVVSELEFDDGTNRKKFKISSGRLRSFDSSGSDDTADKISLSSNTTDDLAEGSSNLYFTTARARAAISASTGIAITDGAISAAAVPNASLTNSSVTINSNSLSLGGTLTLDTDDIGEGSSNLYYTTARWDTKMAAADTDDLSEGSTNLYFTNARARGAISVSGNALSYDSSTGVLTANYEESPSFTGNVTISGYVSSAGAYFSDTLRVLNSAGDGWNNWATRSAGNFNLSVGTISSGQLQVNTGATNTIAVFESTDDKGFIQIKDNDTNAHLIAKDGNFSIADDSATFDTFRIDLDTGNVDISGSIEAASFSDGTISGITFIDEDSFSTNSATRVPTQQSIKAYVDAQVAGVVDSAPAALNTLNELANALGDDANFSTTTSDALGNRLRVDINNQGLTGTQQANAITNLGITATKAELNYVDGVTSNIQTQLDGKQATGNYLTTSTSFGGDVSGTYNNIAVANNSHQHSQLYENGTIDFGASYVQWTDQSSGGTGMDGAAPRNPAAGWYHNLIFNHANSNGYYSQIATGLNSSDIYFTRVQGGTAKDWQRIFADDYHPNADKWTTARTISLGGDLTGNVSIDGSANVTLTAAVVNDSHNHNHSDGNFTVNGVLQAGAGSNHISTAATPFRWQRSSSSQTGQDDNVSVHVDDSNIYFTHNNDADGDASGFNFRYTTGGTATNLLNFSASTMTYKGNTVFHDGYHPNADTWTSARTITLGGDLTGNVSINGSANVTLTAAVVNDSHTHDGRYFTESEADGRFTQKNDFRSLGTQAFTGTATTAGYISEMESDGAFDSYSSAFKTSWSYAGNFNISDAGTYGPTETAGMSHFTWTDNSSDSARGNITVLAIAPNTGGSGGRTFIYNDQGSSYSPGWREIWTSRRMGAGTGLDADKLDAQEGSYYLDYNNFTNTPTIPSSSSFVATTGDSMSGELNITYNTGVTGSSAPDYDNGQLEVQTSSNHVPAIGFHRAGYSATTLYEYDGELYTNAWTTRAQTGKLISSGNYDDYVTTSYVNGLGVNATTLDSLDLHTGRNNEANKVVRTDGNGYIQAGWINTTSGDRGTTAMSRIYASNDGYIRYYTPANFGAQISDHITLKSGGTTRIQATADGGTVTGALLMTGNLRRNNHHVGHLEGSYNNVGGNSYKTSPIYTIGSSYNPAEASLSNMYGIGYAHPNLWGSGKTSDWGMYVANNGSFDATIGSGTTTAWFKNNVIIGGTINTGQGDTEVYLMNQHVRTSDGPTFANVYNNGWFRNQSSGNGLYNTANDTHLYSSNSSTWNINSSADGNTISLHLRRDYAGTVTGTLYGDTSNNFGLLSNDGSWALRVSNSDVHSYHDHRLETGAINGSSISVNKNFGYGFHNDSAGTGAYAIIREPGAWSSPYPDIEIKAHTGLSMGANSGYEGVRIFRDYNDSTRIIQFNGSSNYIFKDVWMHTDAAEGMYSGHNGAHIDPANSGTYGAWRILGSRNSYGGFYCGYSGVNIGMYDSGGNGGDYYSGSWHFYWHRGNSCLALGGSGTSSSYKAYVHGALYATDNIVAYSDRRVKENIVPIDNALEKVNALQGVYYNRIDDEEKKKEIGFIAQDVNEVTPELVTYAEDVDQYGVKYGNTTALLVEAIKELTQKVKELEKKLEEK